MTDETDIPFLLAEIERLHADLEDDYQAATEMRAEVQRLTGERDQLAARIAEVRGYLNEVMAHSKLCRDGSKGRGCHVCTMLAILAAPTEEEGK